MMKTLKFLKNDFCLNITGMLISILYVGCSPSSNNGINADPEGTIHLTAENGKGLGPEIEYMPEWNAFGWFTAADSVVWVMDIESPGKYEVSLEWSVSDEEAGKPFVFYSGDQQIQGTVDKSGSWETFKKETIGTMELSSGQQTFVFKSAKDFEDGALLDLRALTLVPQN